jgi:hypothetical protein
MFYRLTALKHGTKMAFKHFWMFEQAQTFSSNILLDEHMFDRLAGCFSKSRTCRQPAANHSHFVYIF